MGQANGPLTKAQYEQIKDYSEANIVLLDGSGGVITSGVSGSFSGYWEINWTENGFSGGSSLGDLLDSGFAGPAGTDYTESYQNSTLRDDLINDPSAAVELAQFINSWYTGSGCATFVVTQQ